MSGSPIPWSKLTACDGTRENGFPLALPALESALKELMIFAVIMAQHLNGPGLHEFHAEEPSYCRTARRNMFLADGPQAKTA